MFKEQKTDEDPLAESDRRILPDLVGFGRTWPDLVGPGWILSDLDGFGPIWSDLVRF